MPLLGGGTVVGNGQVCLLCTRTCSVRYNGQKHASAESAVAFSAAGLPAARQREDGRDVHESVHEYTAGGLLRLPDREPRGTGVAETDWADAPASSLLGAWPCVADSNLDWADCC